MIALRLVTVISDIIKNRFSNLTTAENRELTIKIIEAIDKVAVITEK